MTNTVAKKLSTKELQDEFRALILEKDERNQFKNKYHEVGSVFGMSIQEVSRAAGELGIPLRASYPGKQSTTRSRVTAESIDAQIAALQAKKASLVVHAIRQRNGVLVKNVTLHTTALEIHKAIRAVL